MKTLLADQRERERFTTELDRNFSVIAAAGTGKTTAITKRILEIAQKRSEWLPRLVVVTFTNRAADEMQQRTRQRIFEAGVPLHVLAAFNRAFFGTIHSFCTKLLTAHGYRLGLPSGLNLISDDDELWTDFVQRTDSVGDSLSAENRRKLLRHVQLRDLMELGRSGKLPLVFEQGNVDCPDTINIAGVLNYPEPGSRIEADKQALKRWKEQLESGSDFVPLVEWKSDSKNFADRRQDALRDFNEWLSCCALKVSAEVQAKYRQFRGEHGVVTFDDQIAFALQLTRNADAIARIRAKDYIVILDEAQDTDPQQFEILLEITRPAKARGRWIDDPKQQPPRAGRFCMVGDFQQSIYCDRADLKQYRRVHDALISGVTGESLKFSVTFRLDQKQVEFVNNCFREILNDRQGQVGLIELEPRPERFPGQVVRLDITLGSVRPDSHDREKARAEATQLANWIKDAGLKNLRAASWEQVAILCPRKNWFPAIADALRRVGIDSQIQSETDVKADSPTHAWFTALLTVMTRPRCAFEIVGILREVFGISDHDLATFCDGYSDRFQIERETGRSGVVASALDLLARIHGKILDKPLFNAAQTIIDSTQLRARLQTLPLEDFENLDRELDVLVQSAATAEAQGMTLEEFTELLRANFTAERDTGAPRAGAIQLITCQKAKGLEWDAVIVPFFSRRIHTRDEEFPQLILDLQSQKVIVAFSKADLPARSKDALKSAHLQEMERLLYVALTRARHTLVLAADRELFGAAPSESLTSWFRSEHGPNQPAMAALPINATACDKTHTCQVDSARTEEESRDSGDFPAPVLAAAAACAADHFCKLNPSRFIMVGDKIERTDADTRKEAEAEFRAQRLPSAATRYGVWWHEFVRKLAWNLQSDTWQAAFDQNVINSPDPGRSRNEWKLLMKCFSARADFHAGKTFAEMPFFWRFDERNSLEGVIDLALLLPDSKRWLLLDWKTNQIKPEELEGLCAYYRPQIATYWKAVGAMTNQPISAGIYSTVTGKLVFYEEKELTDEWKRLKTVIMQQFGTHAEDGGRDKPNEHFGQLEFGHW
jgi:ATP-dependent helicase/nuclease subunit A